MKIKINYYLSSFIWLHEIECVWEREDKYLIVSLFKVLKSNDLKAGRNCNNDQYFSSFFQQEELMDSLVCLQVKALAPK